MAALLLSITLLLLSRTLVQGYVYLLLSTYVFAFYYSEASGIGIAQRSSFDLIGIRAQFYEQLCLFLFVLVISQIWHLRTSGGVRFPISFQPISFEQRGRYERLIITTIQIGIAGFLLAGILNLDFILLTGSYTQSTITGSYVDYINVLLVALLYFAPEKKRFATSAGLFHIFLCILDGHRLRAICTILVIWLFNKKNIPMLMKVLLPIFAITILFLVEFIRSGVYFDSLSSNSILDVLFPVHQNSFNNHQGGVIYSSFALIEYANASSWIERIQRFIPFVMSPLLPQSVFPDDWVMAVSVEDFEDIPGGGMLFAFFYHWAGVIGVLLAGLIFSSIINLERHAGLENPVILILVANSIRTLSYNPVHLVKMPVYVMLVLLIGGYIIAMERRKDSKIGRSI